MKLPIRKSSACERELARILGYFFDQDAVDAGLRFADAFDETLKRIADFPDLGIPLELAHPRAANTRCWLVKGFENYVILYRRMGEEIVVTHLFHGSQDIARHL
jgi:plasmid stabilization system protein ParE